MLGLLTKVAHQRLFPLIFLSLFLITSLIISFISPIPLSAKVIDYPVGPRDVLKIEVWDNQDLSREVIVSLGNTISFPLIGEISVEGHTPEELERIIQSRLADGYLINPQVMVTVKEYNSKKVHVLGQVNKPGAYSLSQGTTIVEIISMAGGLAPDAGQEVYILRSLERAGSLPGEETDIIAKIFAGGVLGDNGAEEKQQKGCAKVPVSSASNSVLQDMATSRGITISLDESKKNTNLHFELQDNDVLYFPKTKFFYVTGEVKSPGRFKLEKEVNVLQAISIAGGATQKAHESKVIIVRTIHGQDQEIKAKMTDIVLSDDIIKVPESFF